MVGVCHVAVACLLLRRQATNSPPEPHPEPHQVMAGVFAALTAAWSYLLLAPANAGSRLVIVFS